MVINVLMVGFGGALGAISRYLINEFFNLYINQSAWAATLIINITGCFLIGLLLGSYISNKDIIFYFFIIGFLGSFTTMSAFSHQVILIADSNIIGAVSYIMLTIILTILATYIGASFTK
tara:strand:- start:331 stop:690 length:360 start_codon:yes stop_codon:yes gene_type:complete